jgi:hypothetical protein
LSEAAEQFLVEWHRIVARRDLDALREILAPDVSLAAPPYWSRFEEHDLVHHLLSLVLESVADFSYQREWWKQNELALEFTGRIGDLDLQGIDLITLDDSGRVSRLDVLIRPHDSVAALRDVIAPQMARFLAERSAADPGS